MDEGHIPVLLDESVRMLRLSPGMVVVDGTLGGGGHAKSILERILPGGRLIGIDRDAAAIARASMRLKGFQGHFTTVRDDFKNIAGVLSKLKNEGILKKDKVDGAILDLGVSSFQLDDDYRGFSYSQDARLDMRMDQDTDKSAYDVINGYKENDLAFVIGRYGEERWARRIARYIVMRRKIKPVKTTFELVDIIKAAIPAPARRQGPHPAKRTFQALRIEVNGELHGLEEAIGDFAAAIRGGGRLAVISFHSLEDRIVKQAFGKLAHPCVCPPDAPVCVCGKRPVAVAVTKKPIRPDEREKEDNPRARSAKLRVVEIL